MSNFLLLFVCTGNICRSPMAEGIMNDLILDEVDTKHRVMPIEIMSAGIYAVQGGGASHFAVEVAAQNGINLNFHRSKQLSENLAKTSNLILTMERNHTDYIKNNWPEIDCVYELRSFGRDDESIDEPLDIIDPIGMGFEVYQSVFEELKREITRISQTVYSRALEKYRAK